MKDSAVWPINRRYWDTLTKINSEADEHYQTKPGIERWDEVSDGDSNVEKRRQYAEDNIWKKRIDTAGSTVDGAQHFSCFSCKMPS